MDISEISFVVCLYVSCCLHDSSGLKIPKEPLKAIKITVDTTVSKFNCSRGFLSVGFPHYIYKWGRFDLRSPKVINLASALRHSSVRLYGTPLLNERDIEQYSKDKDLWQSDDENDDQGMAEDVFHDPKKLILSVDHWNSVVEFLKKVGWTLMMDFTALIHKKGKWVSRYASTLLDVASRNKIPIPEFQLGNEPNIYDPLLKINESTVVRDFRDLRELLKKTFPFFGASKIIGPDVTKFPTKTSKKKFFEEFLKAGGCDQVDEVSFHHYYFKKEAGQEDFLNYKLLDKYKSHVLAGYDLMKKYNCTKPLRLTETASSVGGGTEGLSNSFISGFSWMDKLGMSALHGITRVFRHTFFGSYYALVSNDLTPNPDYYLSLVFSKFVEGPVFKVKSKLPKHIRAYANCANQYAPGALIFYLMNLKDKNVYLNFTKYSNHVLSIYLFTAYEDNLAARNTVLNNKTLTMQRNSLPLLKETRQLGNAIKIPPFSYAFVVATRANVPLCVNYFRERSQSVTTTGVTTTGGTATGGTATGETTGGGTTTGETTGGGTTTGETTGGETTGGGTTAGGNTTGENTTGETTGGGTTAGGTATGENTNSSTSTKTTSTIKTVSTTPTAKHRNTTVSGTTQEVTSSSWSSESASSSEVTFSSESSESSSETSPVVTRYDFSSSSITASSVIFSTILGNLPDDAETATPGNQSTPKPSSPGCVVMCSTFLLLRWVFFDNVT